MRAIKGLSWVILAATSAVPLGAQSACLFQDDYYEPVDIHPSVTFAENQERILSWLGCDPKHPESCVVAEHQPRFVDNNRLRQHAWETFAALTAPAKYKLASSSGLVMPRWITWYSNPEVVGTGDTRNKFLGLARSAQLAEGRAPDLKAEIRYNQPTCEEVRKSGLTTKAGMDAYRSSGKPVRLPDDSIAIKTSWLLIAGDARTEIPVFDPQRASPSGSYNSENWRKVAVCPNNQLEGCSLAPHRIYLEQFFFVPASFVKFDLPIPTVNGRELNPAIDFLVLVAFHFTTREIPNWVWGTFWWHDFPNSGPFAADRPTSGLEEPWTHYLMDVAYDMDFPRETSGEPKIAFNPYLEGALDNGSQANCVSCHSRAVWPLPRPRQTLVGGSALTRPGQIVVRGSEAARTTYFPESQSSMFLDFIWSLSHPK